MLQTSTSTTWNVKRRLPLHPLLLAQLLQLCLDYRRRICRPPHNHSPDPFFFLAAPTAHTPNAAPADASPSGLWFRGRILIVLHFVPFHHLFFASFLSSFIFSLLLVFLLLIEQKVFKAIRLTIGSLCLLSPPSNVIIVLSLFSLHHHRCLTAPTSLTRIPLLLFPAASNPSSDSAAAPPPSNRSRDREPNKVRFPFSCLLKMMAFWEP